MKYSELDRAQLLRLQEQLRADYQQFAARDLHLDMSRGKPSGEQLDLSLPLLHVLDDHNFIAENGMDVRNYGEYRGIPEARRLFAQIFDVPAEQVLVGGNSSINMICDALKRCFLNGALPGDTPWAKLDKVKFICPVPGYDWHFHICETFGIEMIAVEMDEHGPLMDEVERLVAADPSIKGMITVPMYSNPSGVTYSDEVVRRLAAMPAAAHDFRLIWDNAYCLHHLYDDKRDRLANIYTACEQAGHADRVLMFTSTSKITTAGSGICAMAASPANIEYAASLIMYQLVCYDKLNQLRHCRFLPDLAAVEAHMRRHAAILRPKFDTVLDTLDKEIAPLGIAHWHRPLGGYFVCFYAPDGCAKRIVQLCKDAGVTLTPAGAPYPHGIDPHDNTIRIAPTYPPLEELRQVMVLFVIAVKLAAVEKLLNE
ncbi:MAG: aminotransferase class I/II-fold pyridoxal phosphate-dependent enzyme [Bacillota bacterium]|nr:aminotransferase class I/II-fold pyridoxal phosphate-dependent enzyme [Bacillota bacterium]